MLKKCRCVGLVDIFLHSLGFIDFNYEFVENLVNDINDDIIMLLLGIM